MQEIDVLFYIAILVMSVVIHEVSHGLMALYYGDHTARLQGRLTLNPLAHIDLFGSIILPTLLYFTAGFVVGWAKPVPYNPNNLRDKRWGEVAVAAAGVLANILLAFIFGLLLRFIPAPFISPEFLFIVSTIVLVNLGLAIFNLVPIPPLDGSKVLFGLLPYKARPFIHFMEQYSLILLIAFILFFSEVLYPILVFSFRLFTGLSW